MSFPFGEVRDQRGPRFIVETDLRCNLRNRAAGVRFARFDEGDRQGLTKVGDVQS